MSLLIHTNTTVYPMYSMYALVGHVWAMGRANIFLAFIDRPVLDLSEPGPAFIFAILDDFG